MSNGNIGADPGVRTDAAFWDAQWSSRERSRILEWLFRGHMYGKRGAVLQALRQVVGASRLQGARVVEIGGAGSRILVDLARWAGAHVTAVDYSPVGIRETERMFREAAIVGDVVLADVFDWHGGDGVFDVVTHWGVLEHFEDPRPMLRASARLAKPDGIIFFSMPDIEAPTLTLWRRLSPQNYAAHVWHSDAAVERACREAGLALERVFRRGAPLARLSPPEQGSLIIRVAVNVAHAVLLLLARFIPGFESILPKALASQRYFVARQRLA